MLWVGELQAISRYISFALSGACLAYVPEFLAKTESVVVPCQSPVRVYPEDIGGGESSSSSFCFFSCDVEEWYLVFSLRGHS